MVQIEAPRLLKQHSYLTSAACIPKHVPRPPEKPKNTFENYNKSGNNKKRAWRTDFKPKTNIDLKSSLNVKRSTISKNGLSDIEN